METEYPFSTERSSLLGTEAFRNLLGASIKNAKESVVILSAYVKEVGVKWMQEQITDSKVKCTIVVRWDKGDLAQDSSDLDCYLLAKEKNWDFKILKDLHAKVMLVDNNDLFVGSPNLTGRGMSLVPVSNKEMGVKLKATEQDIYIIKSLLEDSYEVNDELFNYLKNWKNNLPKVEKVAYPDFPQEVKDKLKENYKKIWVHNFPWSTPDELLNIIKTNDNINHDLELFGLSIDNINEHKLKKAFSDSKIFKWFLRQISKQEEKEIYFGNLSSIIDNSLLDDPRPYRKEIKELQKNFYTFLKTFDYSEIKLDRPNHSERVKLVI
jgi:hypothetical protein